MKNKILNIYTPEFLLWNLHDKHILILWEFFHQERSALMGANRANWSVKKMQIWLWIHRRRIFFFCDFGMGWKKNVLCKENCREWEYVFWMSLGKKWYGLRLFLTNFLFHFSKDLSFVFHAQGRSWCREIEVRLMTNTFASYFCIPL